MQIRWKTRAIKSAAEIVSAQWAMHILQFILGSDMVMSMPVCVGVYVWEAKNTQNSLTYSIDQNNGTHTVWMVSVYRVSWYRYITHIFKQSKTKQNKSISLSIANDASSCVYPIFNIVCDAFYCIPLHHMPSHPSMIKRIADYRRWWSMDVASNQLSFHRHHYHHQHCSISHCHTLWRKRMYFSHSFHAKLHNECNDCLIDMKSIIILVFVCCFERNVQVCLLLVHTAQCIPSDQNPSHMLLKHNTTESLVLMSVCVGACWNPISQLQSRVICMLFL